MLFEKNYAFVDESGDASLNVASDGASTHFIVAAILVKGDLLDAARNQVEQVRGTYFGAAAEMKSSNVGANDQRRIDILHALSAAPTSYYAFVVNKRKIHQDSGLIFKKPFLKFLSGKVYSRVYRTFPNIDIVADEHGSKQFMDGFEKYVREYHQPELFEKSTFRFVSSTQEPLVQVADIVAGSVAKLFDEKRKSENPGPILAAMRGKLVCLEEWPPVYHSLSEQISTTVAADHDAMVREYCKNRVSVYLEELSPPEATDPDEVEVHAIREAVLSYLADRSRDSETDKYVSAAEILQHIETLSAGALSEHAFRTRVIAHYRDHGVIIATSTTGYKIPTCVQDIRNYVNRCESVVGPMLARLKQAREQIRMMSHNTLDIVGESHLAHLRNVIDSL